MFKCGCGTLQDMSDERFREHQRAVDSGDMNALPSLITEAVRTSTPIYKYAGRILYNLNDNVVRALEQGGLIDIQYYGLRTTEENLQDAFRRINLTDKVIPSLELNLINNAVVRPPGYEYVHAVKASCFWSSVFDCRFLIRETPLRQMANGARIGTFDISPYGNRASADANKPAQERAVLVHGKKTPDTPGLFFGLEHNELTISDVRKDGTVHPLTIHLGESRQHYTLYSSNNRNQTAIPLTTKHAEHILGNPNVFDFEAIK